MISRLHIFLLVLLVVAQAIQMTAQTVPPEAHFNRYTMQDGLPDNNIQAIVQDDQGFLWIGTAFGLSCFDGIRFTTYFKGDNLENSLPSNFITKLVKLSGGQIFIATKFGVSLLDPVNRTFKSVRIPHEPGMEYELNAIKSLVLTQQGNIVVGSNAGICVFDEGLNIVFHYSHFKKENLDKSLMGFALNMLLLANGDILINGWQGAWRFDAEEQKLVKQDLTNQSERFAERAYPSGKSGMSIMWKEFPDTLFVNEYQSNKNGMTLVPKEIKKDLGWGSKLEFVNDTILGFAGGNGGFRLAGYNSATLRVKFYEPKIFKDHIFNTFLLDREGRWWLASDDGLFGQSFSKGAFHFIPLPISWEDESENNYISALTKAGDYFYIGANNRLLVMDSQLRLLNNLAVPPQIGYIHKLYSWQSGILDIAGNFAWARLQIPEKWGGPLRWKKIGKGEIANIFQLQDRKGEIWGGMFMGLARYNPSTGKEFYYATGQPDGEFPFMGAVNIVETDSGYLWMCGWPGLTRWNPFEQRFDRRYPRVPGTEGQEGRPSSLVSYEGEKMLFYMGDNKVWLWSGDERPARELALGSHGLDLVVGIMPDKHPYQCWLLLKSGIALLNVYTGRSRYYTNFDGLANAKAITDLYLDPHNDSIYICCDNGIVVTNRKNFHFSDQTNPVFITGVQQLSTGFMLNAASNLKLEQPNQDIAISFSSPDFEQGSLLAYAYRLNDGKWQALGTATSVQLANLSPGKYRFEVKSITPEGISSEPAALEFWIKPLFHQTWWFVALMAASGGLAAFGYFRWRIGQLHKMDAMRQAIAADLHDEVGASLTSIQILSQLASHPDSDRRSEALEKLPEQVRRTSASLREIVWNISPSHDSLALLIGELTRYAGEVFEKMNIQYSVQADDFSEGDRLDVVARQHLQRIFKETLNNVAKHSNASRADVVFIKVGHELVVQVRDNGDGFDPATVRRGNGLDNMQARAMAAGGQFSLRSNHADGTETTLRLPLERGRAWWKMFTK